MKKLAAALALVAAAWGPAAHAADVTFSGFAHGSETVTFAVSSPNAPAGFTVSAGGFSTSVNGGASFVSYCVDLYQTISFGSTYNDYSAGPHTFANANALADISRLYGLAGAVNTSVLEAAFQIAVWEIAYEQTGTAYNVASGAATFAGGSAASSGALTQATTWLGMLANASPVPGVGVLNSPGHQDVIFAPVPEPSTVMLMLSGLAGVAALSRRRKKV